MTYGQLLALPRDGQALRGLIRAYGNRSGADPITQIDTLLTEAVLPLAQRASIITAALGFPGVSLERGVRDPLGRSGDALATRIASPEPEFRGRTVISRLIFNPITFAIYAEESVVPGDATIGGVPDNFLATWRAYTTVKVTA